MNLPPGPHNWHGIVASILAVGVVAAVLGLSIGWHHFTSEETTAFSTVVGAMVGALATFLGLSSHNGKDQSK